MLYALQEPRADRLRQLLARPISDDAEVEEALDLLRTGPGLDRSRETLARYAEASREQLAILPDCAATSALATLTAYVVERTG
jgi:heptaprenyl diphosphate synthase